MGNINIKSLTVKYDNNTVLDSVSEKIKNGELYVILGPAGSGKSTLLKSIAGLNLAQGGSIELDGKNILAFNQQHMLDYHKECGFVFQNAALISNMSIYENLSLYYNYHTKMTEKEIYERLKPFLDMVGFEDDLSLRPSTLSTGEKILVGVVRAISHDPKYIFWDNPLALLDAVGQKRIRQLIEDMKKKKKTMVMVTNDSDFAMRVADRIGILHKGKFIESGTPAEIRASRDKVTRELLGK